MNASVGRTARIFIAFVVAGAGGSLLVQQAPAGDVKNGKARYEQYCAVCHGPQGLGNGPMAKATNPPATRLTAPEVRNKTDQDLLAVIADGKGGIMPAWRGILTEQELLDVVAYVRSLGQ
ncbi:MAG: c-type cytochrome [Nitrospiraceae bacterium]